MRTGVKEQIDALLKPRSVAVVGASDNPKRLGGRPVAYFLKFGFKGPIYGVNPKYAEVQGVPCFARPADLPEPVDLAIFSVAAEATLEQFEGMARRGMKAAVIFAGGFAEIGPEGAALQERLGEMAREYGVGINGPNCLGVVSSPNRTYATFSTMLATLPEFPAGDVALVSQSGGFASNSYTEAVLAGGRMSHMISTGNEVSLDYCDYLEYLSEDPATRVVIGYMEGVRDGQRFCRAAAALKDAGKPLLLMKVGKSPGGAETVRSHTGLMSGSDSGFDAAFDRYGAIRLRTMQDLVDHVRLFSLPKIEGGLSVATISGGAAVYVADACEELGVPLTDLQPDTLARLRTEVPKFGIVRNPVDITAQLTNDPTGLNGCLKILADDPGTGAVMFFIGGNEDQSDGLIERFLEIQRSSPKPLVVAWWGVPEQLRLRAAAAGITVVSDPVRFLRPLANRLKATCQPASTPPSAPHPQSPGRIVGEWEAMAMVEQAGVKTPSRWRASSEAEVERVAGEVGYPCVVKLLEPAVAHRAQVGAVLTGVASPGEVRGAWHSLVERHGAKTILVAEQVGTGLEMLVGVVRDPIFGQRVVVGTGGVWTNELDDSATLIPPLDPEYIRERLAALRIWPLLRGGDRQRGYAVDRLVELVMRIADLAWRERDTLAELECNPVIVTRDDAIAVDALGIRSNGL